MLNIFFSFFFAPSLSVPSCIPLICCTHDKPEHCHDTTAYLLDNEEDPDACHDDDEEGEEEPSSEEIDVVREVLGLFPCRSTAHPIILNRESPPAKERRKGHEEAPDPRHNHQDDSSCSAVPGKASLAGKSVTSCYIFRNKMQ